MILGIGTDIVQIDRIEAALQRQGERLAKRILTPREQAHFDGHSQPARYLAKRFAAKEAAAKALGTGIAQGVSFQHFEIDNDALGAPQLSFSGEAAKLQSLRGIKALHLSLSDERDYAVAMVVLES